MTRRGRFDLLGLCGLVTIVALLAGLIGFPAPRSGVDSPGASGAGPAGTVPSGSWRRVDVSPTALGEPAATPGPVVTSRPTASPTRRPSGAPVANASARPAPGPGAHRTATPGRSAPPTPAPTARRHGPPGGTAAPLAGVAGGVASWYDNGPGLYAAVPHWSGRRYVLEVRRRDYLGPCDGRAGCVRVTVRDSCQCYVGTRNERSIDLSPADFANLAPLSRGVVAVVIVGP